MSPMSTCNGQKDQNFSQKNSKIFVKIFSKIFVEKSELETK